MVKEPLELDIVLDDQIHPYWDKYSISPSTLKRFGASSVKVVYRNGILHSRSTRENPIFVYAFQSGRAKLYRPYSPDRKKKWYGDSNESDIGGLNCLPAQGRLVILTKSIKDCMVLWELGFPAVCLNAEGIGAGKGSSEVVKDLMKLLTKRFSYVVILYDNDEAGIKHSNALSNKFGLVNVMLHKAKDISDLVCKFGPYVGHRYLKRRLAKSLSNH